MSEFEMDEHIILCNWGPRGLEWIREVHSKIIQRSKAPSVVIIHDNPEDIHLPDKQDEAAFNDVYIVKGDPSNDVILKRAKVSQAYSVVILADDREGKHADGKTILTCIAIRASAAATGNRTSPSSAESGELQPPEAGRCRRDHLFGSTRAALLARASLYHGMTQVYQELLTVGRDANEMYLVPVPEGSGRQGFRRNFRPVRPPSRRQALLPSHRHSATTAKCSSTPSAAKPAR